MNARFACIDPVRRKTDMGDSHVILKGRLTRDLELVTTSSGKVVGRGTIANNRRTTDVNGNWVDGDAQFFNFEIWNGKARQLQANTQKGSLVFIEGELRYAQWQDKATGQNRSTVFISADNAEVIMPYRSVSAGQGDPVSQGDPLDDIPF
jgi:single-strand DNA-binding protein